MIKYITDIRKEELAGKKILLRVDFDVPIENGKIVEEFRVESHKETIHYLVNAGSKILLVSHLGHKVSDASFLPIIERIGEILGYTTTLVPHSELAEIDRLFVAADVLLLDNMRQDKREVENSDELAQSLSKGFDYYVNDDFATIHRKQSSIVAITKYLPAYSGTLIRKETENLGHAIDAPMEGKILVLGGAKISTKLPVIENFINRADKILIGGAIANNFFKAKGINVGSSVVDDSVSLDIESDKIILPSDILVSSDRNGKSGIETLPIQNIEMNQSIFDIGPETAKYYASIIKNAKMVVWNGPMGLFETDEFAESSRVVAKAVAESAQSIIGGGDSILAADKFGLLDKFSFVSTGGGSMLSFLAGEKLTGLEALGYYD